MRLPNSGAIFPSKSEDISSALEFSSRTIPPNRIGRELPMHFEGFLHEQLEDAGETDLGAEDGCSRKDGHLSSNMNCQTHVNSLQQSNSGVHCACFIDHRLLGSGADVVPWCRGCEPVALQPEDSDLPGLQLPNCASHPSTQSSLNCRTRIDVASMERDWFNDRRCNLNQPIQHDHLCCRISPRKHAFTPN